LEPTPRPPETRIFASAISALPEVASTPAAALVLSSFTALNPTLTLFPAVTTTKVLLASIEAVPTVLAPPAGAGVAVAGTFSLVRFRSAPGTAREIGAIFAVMGMGLIMGMGYIGYAALFTCLIGLAILMYSRFSADGKKSTRKILKITIPENLNYSDVFDEFLEKYTKSYKLKQVKTSNMGSLYKLSYEIVLTDPSIEKEFIDQLRTRNGNLEISLAEYQIQNTDQL
jgi:hypothetical protein